MPNLKNVRYRYCSCTDEAPAARLAKSLLRLGICRPSDWNGGSTVDIIEHGLQRVWAQNRGAAADSWFEGSIAILDTPVWLNEQDRNQTDLETPVNTLYVNGEFSQAQVIPIGGVLELLSKYHELLPVAWWHVFRRGLDTWVRVYDIEEAEEHADNWLDDMTEEERAGSLYGQVGKEVPACMHRDLRDKLDEAKSLELLQTIKGVDSVARKLIAGVLELYQMGDAYRKTVYPGKVREDLNPWFEEYEYPYAGVILDWTENGAIRGCFDEDYESLAQSGCNIMPSHVLALPLDGDPNEVDRNVKMVFDIIGTLQRSLAKTADLIEIINEAQDESIRRHRA
jgi:hypothetical protein